MQRMPLKPRRRGRQRPPLTFTYRPRQPKPQPDHVARLRPLDREQAAAGLTVQRVLWSREEDGRVAFSLMTDNGTAHFVLSRDMAVKLSCSLARLKEDADEAQR